MKLTLIVLTSFYPAGRQALQFADTLAGAVGGRLVLLHAKRISFVDPYAFAGESWRRQELESEAETEVQLTRMAGQLRSPATVELATDLLPGLARDLAARYHPAVFVVGRPAAGKGIPEYVSTIAMELLRAVNLPVLLVPVETPARVVPQRVLIAADSEEFALPDTHAGVQHLLRALHPQLTVAHVSPLEDDAGCVDALAAVQRSGLIAGLPAPAVRGYLHDEPAQGVVEAIRTGQPDLVLVLARAHSYLGELFHRSVTAQVIGSSPVPVLAVPATAPTRPPGGRPRRQADETLRWVD